jgi:DNA-binding Lrp family transcriptional regulator
LERIHILAKVDAGSLEQIIEKLRKVDGITTTDAVTGPYDMVISLEGDSVAKMLSTVIRKIRSIPGIIFTETLVVINLD